MARLKRSPWNRSRAARAPQLDEPGDVPLGRVDLRGLPFLIGSEPPAAERCFLLPGAPASVRIGRPARRVIVAHRLLEPGAPAGHAVGQAVADYVFHLAGGEAVTAPIRERFEIQVVPPEWGRLPFLAVTDTSDYNLPRFEGSWDGAGVRLAEHKGVIHQRQRLERRRGGPPSRRR